ncbi:MAG: hypothetical protein A3F91_00250 [Flavobacteria bacterium RIFCSPLOWO2_12_FULL_35_11]|nr:MAG: hypothetical protein A3F91_00250 [Flavobacteria bacterium RIFCSPLOWO2_12_FULL_35_11]
MKSTKYVILFYFLLFTFLYFFTLNFNYVEGDDASTILYHLCGRNTEIQSPYASYNSGLDFLIKMSNFQGEVALRTFAVTVSFISGFLVLSLLAIFLDTVFEGTEILSNKDRVYLYLLLPFIVPDIIFHSLIINSTYISFVFLLGSLIIFIKFLKTNQIWFLVLSTLLFAIAVPFRWTMLTALPLYMGLALYYNPIQEYSKNTWCLFLKIIAANLAGVILAIVFIDVTGYNLLDIYNTIVSTTGYLENSERSILSILATASAFLTPSLLFLVFLAIFKIIELNKKRPKFSLSLGSLLLLSISPFLIVGFFPSFKFLITIFPMILIIISLGFDYLVRSKSLLIIFFVLLAGPWIIGIQLDVKGTFSGPGFELNTQKSINSNKSQDNNPDKRIKIDKINFKFDSGFYLPMLEGPRPLYGYFYVLFTNGWKNQINLFTQERKKIFEFLVKNKNAVYIQDRKTAYFQCDLYRNGLATQMNFIESENDSYRNFKNQNISINVHVIPKNNAKMEWITNYLKETKSTVIYRSSYSSEILKLYENKENKIEVLGPFTAIKIVD